MKNKIFSAILATGALALTGCQATPPLTHEDKEISKVFEIDGKSKNEIYKQVNVWMSQNYKSAKDVIQYSSKEEGVIVGNGNTSYPCDGFDCVVKEDWTLKYTAQVDVKDNKFRISFTNLSIYTPASYNSGVTYPSREWQPYEKEEYSKLRPFLLKQGESIKASFNSSVINKDW